jgi:hypothetical protein
VSDYKSLRNKIRVDPGSFADVADSLLPLFAESGERVDRRWRLLFGLEPASPPKRAAQPFLAGHLRSPRPRLR